MLLMLEDDADRLARFRSVIAQLEPAVDWRHWRTATSMIAELPALLPHARLIALDHDLEPLPGDTADPGTGYDVIQAITACPPTCPILIHTSNAIRATWMQGACELAGWEYHTIAPIGDDWIEVDWLAVARTLWR